MVGAIMTDNKKFMPIGTISGRLTINLAELKTIRQKRMAYFKAKAALVQIGEMVLLGLLFVTICSLIICGICAMADLSSQVNPGTCAATKAKPYFLISAGYLATLGLLVFGFSLFVFSLLFFGVKKGSECKLNVWVNLNIIILAALLVLFGHSVIENGLFTLLNLAIFIIICYRLMVISIVWSHLDAIKFDGELEKLVSKLSLKMMSPKNILTLVHNKVSTSGIGGEKNAADYYTTTTFDVIDEKPAKAKAVDEVIPAVTVMTSNDPAPVHKV